MTDKSEDDYYNAGGKKPQNSGLIPKKRKKATEEQKQRSDAFWAIDIGPEGIKRNHDLAAKAYISEERRIPLQGLDRRYIFPGLLNPNTGADGRREWVGGSQRLHKAFRRRARRAGHRTFRFLVVIVHRRFVFAEGTLAQLERSDFTRLKASVRRLIHKLPGRSLTTGIIELVLNVDPDIEVPRAWTPHVNLSVELIAPSRKAARALVKEAFGMKSDPSRGVYRPVKVKRMYWLRGGLRYASKGLQLDGIGRRYGKKDEYGHRPGTRKVPLSPAERRELALLLEKIKPTDLVILTGYRRHGSKLVAL